MALHSRKIKAIISTVLAIRTNHNSRSQTCRVWTSQSSRLQITNLLPTCKQPTRVSLHLLMLLTWTIWALWSQSTWLLHSMYSINSNLSLLQERWMEEMDSQGQTASTSILSNRCTTVLASNRKKAAIASNRACSMNKESKRYYRDFSKREKCVADLSKKGQVYRQTSTTTVVGRSKQLNLSNQEPLTCNSNQVRGHLNSRMSHRCLHNNKCPGRTWSARCLMRDVWIEADKSVSKIWVLTVKGVKKMKI